MNLENSARKLPNSWRSLWYTCELPNNPVGNLSFSGYLNVKFLFPIFHIGENRELDLNYLNFHITKIFHLICQVGMKC